MLDAIHATFRIHHKNWNYCNKPVKFALSCFTHSILTCYLISLALALISKTSHENIGFEKLQFINP